MRGKSLIFAEAADLARGAKVNRNILDQIYLQCNAASVDDNVLQEGGCGDLALNAQRKRLQDAEDGTVDSVEVGVELIGE